MSSDNSINRNIDAQTSGQSGRADAETVGHGRALALEDAQDAELRQAHQLEDAETGGHGRGLALEDAQDAGFRGARVEDADTEGHGRGLA